MAFFDKKAREGVVTATRSVENAFDDWLAKYVMLNDETLRAFANVPLADGRNFIVCTSGWSNGLYNAFLGLDASGAVSQLVVEFGIQ